MILVQSESSNKKQRFWEISPFIGACFEIVLAFFSWIVAAAPLKISIRINVRVSTMITAIVGSILAAGTALLGRSGDTFPRPGGEST